MKCGEIKLIEIEDSDYTIMIQPEKGYDVGNGKNIKIEKTLKTGVVGLILDGRGRSIEFSENDQERISSVIDWSESTKEYK